MNERGRTVREPGAYWALARRLFVPAFGGPPIREFSARVACELREFTGAEVVEVWLRSRADRLRCSCASSGVQYPAFPAQPPPDSLDAALVSVLAGESEPGDIPPELVVLRFGQRGEGEDAGLLVLSRAPGSVFGADERAGLAEVAAHLGLALEDRRTHASLRERMKELTCLYHIALLVEQPTTPLDELLNGVVEALPDAWLYPAQVWVRLQLGEATYRAGASPRPESDRLTAPIAIGGRERGTLELGYAEPLPALDVGPFLREEQKLLETVAREIALIVERREVSEQTQRLQEQLLHTERLATIGELAAGIAHELNDPLNNILGYAQLVAKSPQLGEQAQRDVQVIVDSALHSRQVIQQLLLFARRMPQRRTFLDLNQLVQEAQPFLQALGAKAHARLEWQLAGEPLHVSADPDQLRQVLVNLVVNATQAITAHGRVTVSTGRDQEAGVVRLVVEDTGSGIPPEVRVRLFDPFYTTRAEGTGMGLAVVHGIVTSHGGSITVASEPGRGSRFEVTLPAAVEGT